MHTGMKALGFSESAPLAGILSSPRSSVSHTDETHGEYTAKVPARLFAKPFINRKTLRNDNHSQGVRKKKKSPKAHKKKKKIQIKARRAAPHSCVPVGLSGPPAAHRCRLSSVPKVVLLLINDVKHYYTGPTETPCCDLMNYFFSSSSSHHCCT